MTGANYSNLGLPEIPVLYQEEDDDLPNHMADEASISAEVALLNPEQRQVFDSILASVQESVGGQPPRMRAHFLEGPAGRVENLSSSHF